MNNSGIIRDEDIKVKQPGDETKMAQPTCNLRWLSGSNSISIELQQQWEIDIYREGYLIRRDHEWRPIRVKNDLG